LLIGLLESRNERVKASDYDVSLGGVICPFCRGKMIFVDGKLIVKHFRHEVACDVDHNPESDSHIRMKEYFIKKYGLSVDDVEVLFEFNGGKRVADVYLRKFKVVVEIQCSNISYDTFVERNRFYNSLGLSVLWLFKDDVFLKRVKRVKYYGCSIDVFRLNCVLRDVHRVLGRVYFFGDFYIEDYDEWYQCITPYYFKRMSKTYYYGFDNDVYDIFEEVGIAISCFERDGVCLARFFDRHPKNKRGSEMYNFINKCFLMGGVW